MKATVIIEEKQILQKIKRIAYQILESNIKFDTIILAGINGNGFLFAQLIQDQLLQISDKEIVLCEVIMDKKDPRGTIKTSISEDTYLNQSLVLVDDVLNSGTTLMYGVKHFLDTPLKQFKTAVLVNRNHKKYPIKADFKGLSLSTSLQEHIQVVFESPMQAYLV